MCGIIGYIGKKEALPIIVEGLKRLEYRGYDSSGVVVFDKDNNAQAVKTKGKIKDLREELKEKEIKGNFGIGQSRWATHGKPSEINAHPQWDCKKEIFVVHNGIIENHLALKEKLQEKGHKFISETDTEVLAHLIEEYYNGNLEEATRLALKKIVGAYAIAVVSSLDPEKIVFARQSSPLLVGLGDGENFVASDAPAILGHTKQVVYLDDGEMGVITRDDFQIFNLDHEVVNKQTHHLEWDIQQAEKSGYPHFMLKEIFEGPETIRNATRGRIILKDGMAKLGGLEPVMNKLKNIERIVIVAMGTAFLAGKVGEYMLEEYAGIPVEVENASEFRYKKPIFNKNDAVLAISQSGETADTLFAVKEAKRKGALALGIVNVVGSSIAREVDAGVYNHAGPEIAVASTKAFISQLTVLSLLTVFLGRQKNMSLVIGKRILEELEKLPELCKKILEQKGDIRELAEKYSNFRNFLYLGRKYNYPVACEGALKLKEVSYIHAEGMPAGEMKHGPIAMIDKDFPSLVIALQDSVYEKNLSSIEEIRAREGKVIALATEGDELTADDIFYIPKTLEMLSPILSVIPLQFFAYYVAVKKGLDVDKPRNLAKSVTVE